MKNKAILLSLLLASCNVPGLSDMPDVTNVDAVKAAAAKLNPIGPGGSPSPDGMYNVGQFGSDRYFFVYWAERKALEDAASRQNLDYKPARLPSTIAAAIEEERQYLRSKSKAG